MKNALILALLAASPAVAAESHKTVCIWNATGYKVPLQLEWDDLDPSTTEIGPSGWTLDYWTTSRDGERYPPLRLWLPAGPGKDIDTAEDKAVKLAPLDTGKVTDCQKLRNKKLNYRVEEVYGEGDQVTGFKLVGPITNP